MGRVPLYQVIEEDLTAQIRSGDLAPESKLPSEHDLATRYGVSRMTVRQALDRLESAHLLVRHRGSGNFVSPTNVRGRRLKRLSSFSDDLMEDNRSVSTVTISIEVVQAPKIAVDQLGIDPDQEVNHFKRIRMVDGQAAALQDSWLPYSVAPGLARDGIIQGSLYRTLHERYGVELRWADQIMTASELTAEQAEFLCVAAGTAALSTKRTTFDRNGEAVEFAESWMLPQFPLLMRIDA